MDGARLDALACRAAATTHRRRMLSNIFAALSAFGLAQFSAGDSQDILSKVRHRHADSHGSQISTDRKKKRKKKRKCRSPERRCGRTCRNLSSDARHCGSCGNGCESGANRVNGECQEELCITPCVTSTCGAFPESCPLFPANNIWNTPVDGLDTINGSDDFIASIGPATGLHADFGSGTYDDRPIGIPFVRVAGSQPLVTIHFGDYGHESDPGPYPIPVDAPIEGGQCGDGDRHVLVVQSETCTLYELFHASPRGDGSWSADSGARYDLHSNALRPADWTSADAAGLPILPGLVRFEEIQAGAIDHALRFTAGTTRETYVWPARHEAGSTMSTAVPPMGQRFRLKDEFNDSGFSATNQVILTALKKYGMILADNGGNWFLSGVPDDNWDNDDLHELQVGVHGSDFEAVDCSPLMVNEDSGQANSAP